MANDFKAAAERKRKMAEERRRREEEERQKGETVEGQGSTAPAENEGTESAEPIVEEPAAPVETEAAAETAEEPVPDVTPEPTAEVPEEKSSDEPNKAAVQNVQPEEAEDDRVCAKLRKMYAAPRYNRFDGENKKRFSAMIKPSLVQKMNEDKEEGRIKSPNDLINVLLEIYYGEE